MQRKQRQRAESDLRDSFDRIRVLGGRLLHAQEEERAHIARELHDDVSQQLARLKIDLDVLGLTLQGQNAEAVAEEAKRTADIATSIHNLSHRLHPTRLRVIGLVAALESLAAECSRPGMIIALAHDAIPAFAAAGDLGAVVPHRAGSTAERHQAQSGAQSVDAAVARRQGADPHDQLTMAWASTRRPHGSAAQAWD